MRSLLLAATLLLALQTAQAQAQPVWRCGADGRSYATTPCAEGRLLETAAPRQAGDVQAARDAARAESRLADRLAQQRSLDDALTRRAGLHGLRTTPPGSAPDIKPKQQRLEDAGTWPAVRRASRRKPG